MYTAEKQARKEVEERNKIQEAIRLQLAAKKEEQIRKAATLARAEKAGLMASSISKFNSELRKDREEEDVSGKKRSHVDREIEEAKNERDLLRQQRKREI